MFISFLLVTTLKDRGGSINAHKKKTLKNSHSEDVQETQTGETLRPRRVAQLGDNGAGEKRVHPPPLVFLSVTRDTATKNEGVKPVVCSLYKPK